jgi:tRNA nucleotidyltransferase (CCA-adding enzyme)
MEVITSHLNADFDALASMVAAQKYYPNAVIVFPGSPEKSVRDFLATTPVPVDIVKLKDISLESIRRLIIVDIRRADRIGQFSALVGRKGVAVHVFDHHPATEDDIRGHKEVTDSTGSTATILVEMMKKDKIEISPFEATLFALGIYEETGSLIFPSTTARDLSMAAYLIKKGANLKVVSSFIRRELAAEEIDLLNELIHSARDYVIHDVRVKIATASRESYIGDVAYLAHKIRDIEDTDVIFIIVMMEDRVHLIARSHTHEVDVAHIAHHFAGGGHPAAASAVIRDLSLQEVEERVVSLLRENIHPAKTASDIMTSPVKCVSWDSTIRAAEKLMTRFEVNVLPVLKGDEYFGLISREVIEKALFHGLGKSRVSDYCTTGGRTVSPITLASEIEAQMIEQNQRFMPVIEKSRIVGAITRTDILRSLYESLLRKNRITAQEMLKEKPSIGRNLSSTMKSKFPPQIYSILKTAGEVASGLGFSAYLVGGSVRDLLRGDINLDIDIVIEGDGIIFAQVLGKALDAKVKSHRRFGTAVVVTEHLKFDVATARTEYYESPASLPKVEMSSIKKDLYRRDFTINTLAIRLNPDKSGQLLDFFGGQRDIKEKNIRIIHNLSFIEDPTRAFRAIRFSERFGFRISKHTINLIKTAVRINLFDKLSGSRLYDELSLLFLETEPARALRRLAEFDLLRFIHKDITLSESLEATFTSLQETIVWFNLLFLEEKFNRSHLFLMALFEELNITERSRALQRLYVPAGVRKELNEGIENSRKTLARLRRASNRDIYFTLQPLNLLTILFIMAKAKEEGQKKAVSLYLTKLRNMKQELTGEDLKGMGYIPGPGFRKILTAILEERLTGKIKSREDEIAFVRNNFKPGGSR